MTINEVKNKYLSLKNKNFPKSIYAYNRENKDSFIVLAFSYGCGSILFLISQGFIDRKRLDSIKDSYEALKCCLDIKDDEGRGYILGYIDLFEYVLTIQDDLIRDE